MSYSHPQWRDNSRDVWQTSQRSESQSAQSRRSATSLISQTNRQAHQAQANVQNTLRSRLQDVQSMKERVQASRDEVYSEIGLLLASSDEIKSWTNFVEERANTNRKCQSTRSKRPGIESTHDAVSEALTSEENSLKACNSTLNDLQEETLTLVRTLKDSAKDLESDLADKADAEALDVTALTLNKSSQQLGRFRDTVQKTPRGSLMPPDWVGYSESGMDCANTLITESTGLGNNIENIILQVNQTIDREHEKVNKALDRRITEYKTTRNTNIRRAQASRREIDDQQQSISQLESAIQAKQSPLSLATTRLSTRSLRPNMEFVVDSPHNSLVIEYDTLDEADRRLRKQSDVGKSARDQLSTSLNKLIQDDALKKEAAGLEEMCVFLRGMDTNRSPKKTDYHSSKSRQDWQSYGRTRALKF